MMFEKATRMKLRFSLDGVGICDIEDLWDLPLKQLNSLAKKLNKELKEASEEDFLEEKSSEDVITKLQFDIVLHIMEIKKDELAKRKLAKERKEERDKILSIIARKQDEKMEGMDISDLMKRLEELE